jgi:hypothetical protein
MSAMDRCTGCGGPRGTGADWRDGFPLCKDCATAVDQINSRSQAERDAFEYLVRQQEFRRKYPTIGVARAVSG